MLTILYYLGIAVLLTLSTMASLAAIFFIIDKVFGVDSDCIYHSNYAFYKYYMKSDDEEGE